ncbi:hypothetical protein SH661x_004010 [Planctomicrobium sp. SH661]|uniref:hypothetical protein n=1 Tax=Planctomicrobium sp. SH661 TaxID=3448124 RepID=UPI003F5BEA2A
MVSAAVEFSRDAIECERDDVYIPSPQEIRDLCAEIQSGWTEAERARRSRGQAGRQRTVPVSTRRFARLALDRNNRDGWAA